MPSQTRANRPRVLSRMKSDQGVIYRHHSGRRSGLIGGFGRLSRGVPTRFVPGYIWLNGRPNRTASDFYMIHEYAARDLGGARGITAALGITGNK